MPSQGVLVGFCLESGRGESALPRACRVRARPVMLTNVLHEWAGLGDIGSKNDEEDPVALKEEARFDG